MLLLQEEAADSSARARPWADAGSGSTRRDPGADCRPREHALRLVEARPGGTPDTAQVADFIARRYALAHGADIRPSMPRLQALLDGDDRIVAACGQRCAADAPLFLEHYLDQPVEDAIARATGSRPLRRSVVEIGNLAGAGAGALRALIPALAMQLRVADSRWVVFTGARALANGFARLGIALAALAPAHPERLPPAERVRWGRYYDARPQVWLGDVEAGARQLAIPVDAR